METDAFNNTPSLKIASHLVFHHYKSVWQVLHMEVYSILRSRRVPNHLSYKWKLRRINPSRELVANFSKRKSGSCGHVIKRVVREASFRSLASSFVMRWRHLRQWKQKKGHFFPSEKDSRYRFRCGHNFNKSYKKTIKCYARVSCIVKNSLVCEITS